MDSVGGGGISDVFNSDYQGSFPLELIADTTIVSLNQLQTAYLSDANSSTHCLPTSSFFNISLNSPGDIGSQASSDTMSSRPNDVNLIQGSDLELPLNLTADENALTDVPNLLWLSASVQSSQLVAEDIRLAALAMPKATSRGYTNKAPLNESSSDNAPPSQIHLCDFQDCGRLCESHKQLK